MRKIDKAVEIIRGWSDEEIRQVIIDSGWCPCRFGMKGDYMGECGMSCSYCWNEEVEE